MDIRFYMFFLIPILFTSAEYPLFINLIIFSSNRNNLLKKLIIINLFIGIMSLCYYIYNNSIQLYFWIFIEAIGLNIFYFIYIIFFKESVSNAFDSSYIETKDKYINAMIIESQRWELIGKVFKVFMCIHLPIYIIIINYTKVNCIVEVIVQQILLIINYVIWKKYSQSFSNEAIRLKSVK